MSKDNCLVTRLRINWIKIYYEGNIQTFLVINFIKNKILINKKERRYTNLFIYTLMQTL